jgi:hypothetical protein
MSYIHTYSDNIDRGTFHCFKAICETFLYEVCEWGHWQATVLIKK